MGRGKSTQVKVAAVRRGQPVSAKDIRLAKLHKLSLYYPERRNLLESREEDPNTWLSNSGLPIADPDVFRSILHGFKHESSGLRTVVYETNPMSWEEGKETEPNPKYNIGLLFAHGSIYHEDKFVGTFTMSVERDPDNEVEVRIGGITLRPRKEPENDYTLSEEEEADQEKWLGSGFGRAFHEHLEKGLKEQGVSRLAVTTVGAGSYVWAALGYEYDPRDKRDAKSPVEAQKQRAADTLFNATQSPAFKDYPEDVQAEFIRLQEEGCSSVHEIAKVGKEDYSYIDSDGRPAWPGLEMVGSWHGIKIL